MRKKICGLAAACLLGLSPLAAAEDMRFVDADGFTGYYVDVSTIAFGTGDIPQDTAPEDIVEAQVAVVKADRNSEVPLRRLSPGFIREKRSSQTSWASSAYDTKEVLEKSDLGRMPRHYGFSSPMNGIVNFIYEWKAEQERANRKSY